VTAQCRVCGHDNPQEARFCGNCGAALSDTIEPSLPAVASSPAVVSIAAEYAGFLIRLVAALIDSFVVWILYFIFDRISLYTFDSQFSYSFSYYWFLPWWLYYWLFTGLKGQTPGKMAVGVKVVNYQGDRPGLVRAALREILGKIISTIIFLLGFLCIAVDSDKQGWHDKIAGTYVVKVTKKK
jgi:uncharacterized RDD family membrane protein YckC